MLSSLWLLWSLFVVVVVVVVGRRGSSWVVVGRGWSWVVVFAVGRRIVSLSYRLALPVSDYSSDYLSRLSSLKRGATQGLRYLEAQLVLFAKGGVPCVVLRRAVEKTGSGRVAVDTSENGLLLQSIVVISIRRKIIEQDRICFRLTQRCSQRRSCLSVRRR